MRVVSKGFAATRRGHYRRGGQLPIRERLYFEEGESVATMRTRW
jgi:hypothetical protein